MLSSVICIAFALSSFVKCTACHRLHDTRERLLDSRRYSFKEGIASTRPPLEALTPLSALCMAISKCLSFPLGRFGSRSSSAFQIRRRAALANRLNGARMLNEQAAKDAIAASIVVSNADAGPLQDAQTGQNLNYTIASSIGGRFEDSEEQRYPNPSSAIVSSINSDVVSNGSPLDLDDVLNALEVDIPRIIQKEPTWNIYADDFFIKLSLACIGIFRLLGRLSFVLIDDAFVVVSRESATPSILVRWTVKLDKKLNPYEKAIRAVSISNLDFEPTVNVEAVLYLNDQNQVRNMEIQKMELDGRGIQTWPKVEMRCKPADIWRKAKTVVRDSRRPKGPEIAKQSLWDVVAIVKDDIKNFFYKEPNWRYFASDFYIQASLEGINVLKVVERILGGNMSLVVKSFSAEEGLYFEDSTDPLAEPFLRARWRVQLQRPLNPYEQAFKQVFRSLTFSASQRADTDLYISLEAENVFHFNSNFEIDFMRIDNLVVDGRKLVSWPQVKVDQDPKEIWAKIRKFSQPEADVDPLKKLEEFIGSVKLSDLAASIFPLPAEDPRDKDLEKVVEKIKVDISQVFRRELDWGVFAENFYVKTSLEGVTILKLLEKRLLKKGRKLLLESDVPIRLMYDSDSEPFLVARWVFRSRKLNALEMIGRSLYNFWKKPFDSPRLMEFVSFRCETAFHFNQENRIDYMRIDNLMMDGRQVLAFPECKVSEDPAKILERIKHSVIDSQQSEPLNLKDWSSINMIDLNADEVINRWTKKAETSSTAGNYDVDAARQEIDAARQQKLDGSIEILDQLKNDIKWASPDRISILTLAKNALSRDQLLKLLKRFPESQSDSPQFMPGFVFAVATVNEEFVFDVDGKLQDVGTNLGFEDVAVDSDGRVPVIKIDQVAAEPTQAKGFGRELLFQIVRRAAASGRLTILSPANKKLETYYRNLGFEKIDDYDLDMVYSKSLPEVSASYEMAFLQTGSEIPRQVFKNIVDAWDRAE